MPFRINRGSLFPIYQTVFLGLRYSLDMNGQGLPIEETRSMAPETLAINASTSISGKRSDNLDRAAYTPGVGGHFLGAKGLREAFSTSDLLHGIPASKRMTLHKQPSLRNINMYIKSIACAAIFMISSTSASAQAWKNCIPNSIGPGGCDSIGPGGGKSIGPGGGQSIGPGGGKSIGPGGGQSIGPGGGQSINRNRKTGLNPNTLRPYTCSEGGPC